MTCDDSKIYILGRNHGKWINVYNADDGSLISTGISDGSNPDQISVGNHISVDNLTGNIGVFDCAWTTRRFIWFSSSLTPIRVISPETIKVINCIVYLADDRYLILSSHQEEGKWTRRPEYILYDAVTDCILDSYDFPEESEVPEGTFFKEITVSPDGNHIGIVSKNGGCIHLMEVKDDKLSTVFFLKFMKVPHVEIAGVPSADQSSDLGTVSIASDNENVYVAYNVDSDENVDSYIGVLSWDGKIVKKYSTDRKISILSNRTDGKKLYGLTINSVNDSTCLSSLSIE